MPDWVDTAGRLYLFFDRNVPKFGLSVDDDYIASYIGVRPLLPIFAVTDWRGDYEQLHSLLHEKLGNHCRGRLNTKARRNQRDSEFSALVRCGPPGAAGGCFDTPLIDLDAVRLFGDPPGVISVLEQKRERERTDGSQGEVLAYLERHGVEVVWRRRRST